MELYERRKESKYAKTKRATDKWYKKTFVSGRIYSLFTTTPSSSLVFGGGLVSVVRLLRQGFTGQAHALNVLSIKLVNLDFHRPSHYPGLPCSLTDVQFFLRDQFRLVYILMSFRTSTLMRINRSSTCAVVRAHARSFSLLLTCTVARVIGHRLPPGL